ncbi:MAG: hypothetical protein U0Q07_11090 [Acidimicrobiales bacterium]
MGSKVVRVGVVVASVAVVALIGLAFRGLSGSAPAMSLVPELPAGTVVERNETEWTDGAGGIGVRVLVLRSDTIAPAALADQIGMAFDADDRWSGGMIEGHKGAWRLGDAAPCSAAGPVSRTSASVWLAAAGEEVELAQFDSFGIDHPAAVVRISTADHMFCGIGSTIR